jgi:hypothetical protein
METTVNRFRRILARWTCGCGRINPEITRTCLGCGR